jgi:hypothetical protein
MEYLPAYHGKEVANNSHQTRLEDIKIRMVGCVQARPYKVQDNAHDPIEKKQAKASVRT